jgi:hypothetical protein
LSYNKPPFLLFIKILNIYISIIKFLCIFLCCHGSCRRCEMHMQAACPAQSAATAAVSCCCNCCQLGSALHHLPCPLLSGTADVTAGR